ncbi:MAG TPA: GntR family transcriptional regulator, partial [Spirochaetia bacterium]|nr:GntR family transcriptional regulator [Spirochaetia bacterium]
LCERLGVSRITVRSALLSLAQQGILSRRSGSGTFVNWDLSRTGTIVFFRCEHGTGSHEMRNDLVYSEVLEGIQSEACTGGVHLIFSYVREEGDESQRVLKGLSAKADGFIFGEMRNESFYREVASAYTPIVLINPEFSSYSGDSVDYDNLAGAIGATEHLVELGHRYIGFINGRMPTRHAAERLDGYRIALARHGLPFDPTLVAGGVNWQSETGCEAVKELVERNPEITAVFAANDALAVGAIQGLHDQGLDVPMDVSVIGFDDMVIASYSEPKLTTMRVDRQEMGKAAARRLLELLRSPSEQAVKTLFVPKLIVRESCIAPDAPAD